MTRSPVYSRVYRRFDGDIGGDAELQTDVMRFMAILSLCLVAIFALVQSIPIVGNVAPPPATSAPAPERAEVEHPVPVSEPLPDAISEPVPEAFSEPLPEPPQRIKALPSSSAATAPVKAAAADRPPELPSASASTAAPDSQGFTLQFATDRALTELVRTQQIGLYALGGETTVRLAIAGGGTEFWPASRPRQYHEMDPATVPGDIVAALRRSGYAASPALTWGVTLPPAMSAELQRILSSHDSGTLLIDASGILRRAN